MKIIISAAALGLVVPGALAFQGRTLNVHPGSQIVTSHAHDSIHRPASSLSTSSRNNLFPDDLPRKGLAPLAASFVGVESRTESIPEDRPRTEDENEKLFERFGKGVARDFTARLPLYGGDIKDGLNLQCLAATMFLFFACM